MHAPQVCELCADNNTSVDYQVENLFAYPEHVSYLNNFPKGQENSFEIPYHHNYNPNWRTSHPNLSWSNIQNAQHQNFQAPEKKTNVEDILGKFMESTRENEIKQDPDVESSRINKKSRSADGTDS